MAIYDRTWGTASQQSAADSRHDRPLRLDWSAIFGGTLIGWGALLLLSLIGMALGLSVIDPFDFFPQHLQPQPLILGCRQFVACNRECTRCVAESCGIASVQIRVGKDCIQLGDPRLQSRDPGR